MNALDKAKIDAKKFADEVRNSAQKIRQDVSNRFDSVQSQNYNYVNLIHQLRTFHLIFLAIQIFTLYFMSHHCGYVNHFTLVCLIAGNIYLTGKRWYYHIDGRYDLYQIKNVKEPIVKAKYSIELFGGFLMAFLTYCLSPVLNFSLLILFYNLSKYLSLILGSAIVGVEIYENIITKSQ